MLQGRGQPIGSHTYRLSNNAIQAQGQDITFAIGLEARSWSASLYRGLGGAPLPRGSPEAELPVGVKGRSPLKLKAL